MPRIKRTQIAVPKEKIGEFCGKYHVQELLFFGSVLRKDFGPDSDVDVLVDLEPGQVVGFLRLALNKGSHLKY